MPFETAKLMRSLKNPHISEITFLYFGSFCISLGFSACALLLPRRYFSYQYGHFPVFPSEAVNIIDYPAPSFIALSATLLL